MEALACRLPVVATNLSGVPELVRPGETGLLVPPADAQALATALTAVYADPTRSFALATAGYELVRQDFHLQKNVGLLADLLTHHVERPMTANQVIFRALEPPINSDLWPGSKFAPMARKDEQ
jgi:glycosyltransferase involved in cell wall biosynthesis